MFYMDEDGETRKAEFDIDRESFFCQCGWREKLMNVTEVQMLFAKLRGAMTVSSVCSPFPYF